jgi:hypothetical protein
VAALPPPVKTPEERAAETMANMLSRAGTSVETHPFGVKMWKIGAVAGQVPGLVGTGTRFRALTSHHRIPTATA